MTFTVVTGLNMTEQSRADFSDKTKSQLAMAADHRCVRPGCARKTHFFDRSTDRYVHIGAASHDAAASANGPRPNDQLTREQLRAYENGAWLCAFCARLVDVAEHDFPYGTLASWQEDAENKVKQQVFNPIQPYQVDRLEAVERAVVFCNRFIQIHPECWGSRIVGMPVSELGKIDSLIRECYNLRTPMTVLSTLFPHTVAIQERLIHGLQKIRVAFHVNTQDWLLDNTNTWRPIRDFSGRFVFPDTLGTWWSDAYDCYWALCDFHQGRSDVQTYFLW